jgi:hypothetical protein
MFHAAFLTFEITNGKGHFIVQVPAAGASFTAREPAVG